MGKMIKIKLLAFIFFFCIYLVVHGQYHYENRDIQLSLVIHYLNDTTLKVTGSIINKMDNCIYHSGFALNLNHEESFFYGYSDNELVIQLGDVSKMVPVEYLISVHLIESEDTLYFEQTITSQFFNTKSKLYLSFDYLNLNKFDKETRNKIDIIPYPEDKSGILGCPQYRYYCDWFKLEIPYQHN